VRGSMATLYEGAFEKTISPRIEEEVAELIAA
jgi:hypothetical protein